MSDAILTFSHVTKRFPSAGGRGMFTAVEDASFDMVPGEILGLLGESGCGKSTLARMLMKLIPVSEGTMPLPTAKCVTSMVTQTPWRRPMRLPTGLYLFPFKTIDEEEETWH